MTGHGRVTRRDLLVGRLRRAAQRARAVAAPPSGTPAPAVAVISGRHCLAYRNLVCTTCYERCPESGAIVVEAGLPRVVADACTGCGVCRDVCPAPRNAVVLIKPKPVPAHDRT